MLSPASVSAIIRDACLTEIRAFKPGNVSAASAGHRMEAADFVASADAMAPAISAPGSSVGRRILDAIEATRAVVSFNTNLGIALLCAPLAHAAVLPMEGHILAPRLQRVLAALDLEDAELAYRAVRLAGPGGLGRSERHDISQAPRVALGEAMREARDRDRIAGQYASGYRDIFETGIPALREGLSRWRTREWATVHVYLEFLARFPDSHVVRKHGAQVAADVSRQARELSDALGGSDDPVREMPKLEAFDRQLKAESINPGTSADLAVATLAAMDLEHSLGSVAARRRAGVGASG